MNDNIHSDNSLQYFIRITETSDFQLRKSHIILTPRRLFDDEMSLTPDHTLEEDCSPVNTQQQERRALTPTNRWKETRLKNEDPSAAPLEITNLWLTEEPEIPRSPRLYSGKTDATTHIRTCERWMRTTNLDGRLWHLYFGSTLIGDADQWRENLQRETAASYEHLRAASYSSLGKRKQKPQFRTTLTTTDQRQEHWRGKPDKHPHTPRTATTSLPFTERRPPPYRQKEKG